MPTATRQRLLPPWSVDRAACVSTPLSAPGTLRLPISGEQFVLFYISTDKLFFVNISEQF